MVNVDRKALPVLMTPGGCGVGLPDTGGEPASRETPVLTAAKALSQHHMELTFDAPVGNQPATADAYTITRSDGQPLRVHDAYISDNGRTVLLVTDAQKDVPHSVALGATTMACTSQTGSMSEPPAAIMTAMGMSI